MRGQAPGCRARACCPAGPCHLPAPPCLIILLLAVTRLPPACRGERRGDRDRGDRGGPSEERGERGFFAGAASMWGKFGGGAGSRLGD